MARAPRIDLTACERDPIHSPDAIQPHGALLVVDPESECILRAAGEALVLPAAAATLAGRPLAEVLGAGLRDLAASAGVALGAEPAYLGSVQLGAGGGLHDVVAHLRDGVALLELEPAPRARPSGARMLAVVRGISAALEAAPDLAQCCERAAIEMRRLTGFDRVMIYRFLDDGSGCVFAEDRDEALPSLLRHHYPASDIPSQARALYRSNPIRVIPDVAYRPAPLLPALPDGSGTPLDMSHCALRSVAPVHLEYLRNMEVGASMSVSILCKGALWGLIACHHRTPRLLSFEVREACKHLGHSLAQQITAREEVHRHSQGRQFDRIREEVLRELRGADKAETALAEHVSVLRRIIPSDGVAVCLGGRLLAASGHRPPDAGIEDLAEWRLASEESGPYATDRLSEARPAAAAYRAVASGLLAIVVAHEPRIVLLWFRAEQQTVIDWAGNPHKAAEIGPAGALTPRASFALWRETVGGRARPWMAAELDAAQRFRDAVFEFSRQRQQEALNRALHDALADKDAAIAQMELLMREVHHRVQNSLQLVNSMLRLQEREVGDPALAAHFAEAQRRLMAVAAVHRRLWRSDQIHRVGFDTYLEELRDGLVEGWGSQWDSRVVVRAVPLVLPTDTAILLALAVTELLTNAVKHAYGGAPGPITVQVTIEPERLLRVVVSDRGKGIAQLERPDGFGSRLTRALVAQARGTLVVEDNAPGTRAVLSLPLPSQTAFPGG